MEHISYSNLSKPIYDKIKSMILSNELKPGQKIIQEKLAAELGVSRTPLNKALHMLEFELLVESIPRKGMFVKKIDLTEMLDVFDCRAGIDAVAARIAASKCDPAIAIKLKHIFEPFIGIEKIPLNSYKIADEKFHKELINSAGNKILSRLFSMDNLSRKAFQLGLVRPPEKTLKDHLKIIDAISKNDPNKAANAAAMHIQKSRNLIATLIKERKDLQFPK